MGVTLPEGLRRILGASDLAGVSMREVEQVPEPYAGLLCHERDMTSTLAQYHGGEVVLEVKKVIQEDEFYGREVVLRVRDRVVEYGVIEVVLAAFPEEVRERIIAEEAPLGAILNGSGVRYESRPVCFFEAGGVEFLDELGGCFGRYNELFNVKDAPLARIVEILPR